MNKSHESSIGSSAFYIISLAVVGILVIATMVWLLVKPGIGPFISLGILASIIFLFSAFKDFPVAFFISKDDFENARIRAAQNPDKAKPAWDIAAIKLETYIETNLQQIKLIFKLSVVVLIIGFTLISIAIFLAMKNPEPIMPVLVSGIGGALTEFIGATFLILYRSAIAQSAIFIKSLDKTNSVGVAIQILDSVSSEDSKAIQKKITEAKIDVAKLLLADHSKG